MSKIIYVEDDQDTAEVTATLLKMNGFKVDIALTAKKGLEMINKNKYDLAILDFMMPDMSGYDLLKKVNKKKMKFVFLSAMNISDEEIRDFKKAGVSSVITKPYRSKDLVMKIKDILKS
jgi:DNA-binding response OmpR family regulator